MGTQPAMLARAQDAYNNGFVVATVIMLAGVAVSLGLTNRRPSDEDEAESPDESARSGDEGAAWS